MILKDWSKYTITDLTTLRGKKVLLRVDLNLPHDESLILDETRLDEIIPYIKQLSFSGAKIILLSHFGEKGESIKPVADIVSRRLNGVTFIEGTDMDSIRAKIDSVALGDMVMLENSRLFQGETDNTPSCARNFASLGEVFINDAFSASHRKHASIVGVTEYILSYFGPTFIREVTNLSQAANPDKPALLIIGGSKISTKLDLITHYLEQGVKVFVGGAMAHNILKKRGYVIGESLYDSKYEMAESFYNHPLLTIPVDVVLEDGQELKIEDMPEKGVIVDCGKETLKILDEEIAKARTIIINGPLGLYEKGFAYGTEHMMTSAANAKEAKTYIGGGDTVAVAEKAHILSKFSFVSLGGGAMLDYLANGTLPGIDAVTKQK